MFEKKMEDLVSKTPLLITYICFTCKKFHLKVHKLINIFGPFLSVECKICAS